MIPNKDPRRADIKDLLGNVEINRKWNSPFVHIASEWIFRGLPSTTIFNAKQGINKNEALDHISRIINSTLLSHDTRVYQSAHLMSIWFDKI